MSQRGEVEMISSSGGLRWRRAANAVAPVLLTMAALVTSRAAPAQQPADMRLSRYTTTSAAPDIAQTDPLEAIVQISLLHTWGQNLLHHPHLHCVVLGGGISPDGQRWITCRPGFFLPVRVLSRVFRRLFLAQLRS